MTTSRKILLVLIILTVCFIWSQSIPSQDASNHESETFTEKVVHPVEKVFTGKVTTTNDDVRKMAHVAEFLFLAILTALFIGTKGTKIFRTAAKTFSYCGAIAFVDESIQMFSGRGALIRDMWLDLIGTLIGILPALVFLVIGNRKHPNSPKV